MVHSVLLMSKIVLIFEGCIISQNNLHFQELKILENYIVIQQSNAHCEIVK